MSQSGSVSYSGQQSILGEMPKAFKSTDDLCPLIEAYRKGDQGAYTKLISGHIRVAIYLANCKKSKVPVSYHDDLLAEALHSLVDAIDKFKDKTEHTNILKYITCTVNGALITFMSRLPVIYVPRSSYMKGLGVAPEVVPIESIKSSEGTLRFEDLYPEDVEFQKVQDKRTLLDIYRKARLNSFETKLIDLILEGNSYVEIAKIYGVRSSQTVKNWINKIRDKMEATHALDI